MIDKKKLEEESGKYTFYELIYMVSQKCKNKQKSESGCTGCDFLNCHVECCLCGIDEDLDPSMWKDIEVEDEDDDYWELTPAERRERYLEDRYEYKCQFEEGGRYPV